MLVFILDFHIPYSITYNKEATFLFYLQESSAPTQDQPSVIAVPESNYVTDNADEADDDGNAQHEGKHFHMVFGKSELNNGVSSE